jgi:hypothetical protein
MSSAISTDQARLKPDTSHDSSDESLQPWQFFVLAALGCATAMTFIVRGQGVITVVLLTILMGTTALVGLAALRMLRPLMRAQDDRTPMVGARTRAALEREKLLTLRAIKDLEFDRAMGKLSEGDFRDMSERLRARAMRLMKALDAGAGYREQVERDLLKRLKIAPASDSIRASAEAAQTSPTTEVRADTRTCAACSTGNERDARFCKQCGSKL